MFVLNTGYGQCVTREFFQKDYFMIVAADNNGSLCNLRRFPTSELAV